MVATVHQIRAHTQLGYGADGWGGQGANALSRCLGAIRTADGVMRAIRSERGAAMFAITRLRQFVAGRVLLPMSGVGTFLTAETRAVIPRAERGPADLAGDNIRTHSITSMMGATSGAVSAAPGLSVGAGDSRTASYTPRQIRSGYGRSSASYRSTHVHFITLRRLAIARLRASVASIVDRRPYKAPSKKKLLEVLNA